MQNFILLILQDLHTIVFKETNKSLKTHICRLLW